MKTTSGFLTQMSHWLETRRPLAKPLAEIVTAAILYVEVLILDLSVSMDKDDYPPSRLDGAKQAAIRFIEQCAEANPDALIGVVSYSSDASLVAPPQLARRNLRDLTDAVKALSIDGDTNIAAGLEMAGKAISEVSGQKFARAVLLTDGYHNCKGRPLTEARRLKEGGVQLEIIGIGGSPADVNESDLKEMASIVNGQRRYWFIRSVGELVARFEKLALREVD